MKKKNIKAMTNIIQKAMNECALRYSKGMPRWAHLWDEKLTIEQKANQIDDWLRDNGYVVIQSDDLHPLTDDDGE